MAKYGEGVPRRCKYATERKARATPTTFRGIDPRTEGGQVYQEREGNQKETDKDTSHRRRREVVEIEVGGMLFDVRVEEIGFHDKAREALSELERKKRDRAYLKSKSLDFSELSGPEIIIRF
ncbi:hypothetical protein V6N12_064598 [Hibiscus sabdariffa]|uniref:Uncharacterized protein n=1 Tax=Hibiscus sabdariffa TaxID=183260 RepID=A0ABR2G6I0_9ROSI